MKLRTIFIAVGLLLSVVAHAQEWKTAFEQQLPFLGHRNWVLVVDKAFPAQSSTGIETFYVDEDIPHVASFVLEKIETSRHLKPIVYFDKEFNFLTDNLVPQIEDLKKQYQTLFKSYTVQTLLHESVFKKIDKAAGQFNIIVLKTNQLVPYSSVFIELDCGYWNNQNENELRTKMKKEKTK
jgi:hypothetical protein